MIEAKALENARNLRDECMRKIIDEGDYGTKMMLASEGEVANWNYVIMELLDRSYAQINKLRGTQ